MTTAYISVSAARTEASLKYDIASTAYEVGHFKTDF